MNHLLFCSLAKTLGALTVTQGVFDLKKELILYSHVVTDKEAVEACAKFAGLFNYCSFLFNSEMATQSQLP